MTVGVAVLGAIVGGGRSRRFGADKAAALVRGVPLIEHVRAALAAQTEAVLLCGRTWRDWASVPDRPGPDLGPLGGLNAALHYGRAHGFAAVLTAPVDTLPLPPDLTERLGTAPACFADQPLIGLWPTALADALDRHLAGGHRSVRSWVERCGARAVDGQGLAFVNVNRPGDLPA